MKKIINYENSIQFKTPIGEICTISLEHDFTVDDRTLKGEFIIEGSYKPNSLSLNKENFTYRLPLEYDLEDKCDIETLSYDIENFEYNVNGDTLEVAIDFGIRYEERTIEPVIPTITEEELNRSDFETVEMPLSNLEEVDLEVEPNEDVTRNTEIDESEKDFQIEEDTLDVTEERLNEDESNLILDTAFDEDKYITYHVHIIREGETLDSIASKYGVTVEKIKEYNSATNLELKAKLIIPSSEDE